VAKLNYLGTTETVKITFTKELGAD